MLGHKLFLGLGEAFEVHGSVRSEPAALRDHGIFTTANTVFGRDMLHPGDLERTLDEVSPDAVVNAIGIVKQRPVSADVLVSLELNAVLPHRLARLCADRGARVIHVSTDCVFAGTRGGYTEDDISDATDVYGRTKQLGEVTGPGCLTLRTSIIGLELARFRSLIEWFVRQKGTVPGFRRAIFSGLTTAELTRVIGRVLADHPDLSGLFHVASQPISKFDLLARFADLAGMDVDVVPDDKTAIDRSLNGTKFFQATGYSAPPWDRMLAELAEEYKARG